jgi:plastocyanin
MRRGVTALGLTAMLSLGVLGASAIPAGAAKSPVKLSGTVNDEGTKDVSKKSDATLDMELDNFYFGPTFVKAKKGETITLEVENESTAPHTFTSDALGVDEQVSPGQSASIEITVPSSGNAFLFYCRFHQGAGMQGALFTKAGAKVTTSAGAGAGSNTGSNTGSTSSGSGSSGSSGSSGTSGASGASGAYGY